MPYPKKYPEQPLPDWLQPRPVKLVPPPESKALQIAQYDVLFPRVLEQICSGDTLAKAVRELPIEIDSGAFFRWIKKDRGRHDLYKEAKEVCAEVWSGKLINIAEGVNENGDDTMEDVTRSKLKFDIYKWLMERYNRKEFGDVKTVDFNTTISVKDALSQARSRVEQIIDVEAEELTDANPLMLAAPSGEDESEDEDA